MSRIPSTFETFPKLLAEDAVLQASLETALEHMALDRPGVKVLIIRFTNPEGTYLLDRWVIVDATNEKTQNL